MSARFNLQPDPRFESLKDGLRERVQSAANTLDAETFADLLDSTMRSVVSAGFAAAGAHEGSIWLAERSSGPQAKSMRWSSPTTQAPTQARS